MEKVIFENLPSTNSAISASNLMKMQDNIETAIKLPNWGNTEDLTDYEGDLDNLTVSGFYVTNEDALNQPISGCYYVLVMTKNHDYYVKQIAFSRNSNRIYQRFKDEKWSEWECLYDFSTTELILQNSWEDHYNHHIVRDGNMIHICFFVKNGTDTLIATLPEGFRPKYNIYVPANKYGDSGTVILINTNGNIICESADVGSLISVNATLLVE